MWLATTGYKPEFPKWNMSNLSKKIIQILQNIHTQKNWKNLKTRISNNFNHVLKKCILRNLNFNFPNNHGKTWNRDSGDR